MKAAVTDIRSLQKNWSFPLRIFSVNVTKSVENCCLVTFTEEILNGKLHFLCSGCYYMSIFYSMLFKALSQVWDNFWQPKVVDETIKNAFYFTLKSLFVLEIFQFLLWIFSHVGKWLDKKTKLNFKTYDVTQWIRSHYHTEEIAHKVKAIRQLNLVSH